MSYFDAETSKYCVRLNEARISDDEFRPVEYIFGVLHEIAEQDYFIKSKDDPTNVSIGAVGNNYDTYNELEDETIANQRAMRILNLIYPNTEI